MLFYTILLSWPPDSLFKGLQHVAGYVRGTYVAEGKNFCYLSRAAGLCRILLVMESPYELLRQEFEQARSCFIQNRKNKFCILCRRYKPKDIILSHVIPHSVLKSTDKNVHKIGLAGQEVGPSRLGYRGYCKSCEGMLSRGEQHFNQLMHAPLVDNHDSAVYVRSKDAAAIYHCAISMWWRFSSLSSLACENLLKEKTFGNFLNVFACGCTNPMILCL